MRSAAALRLSGLCGLTLAAAAAFWWLGSTRLALRDGADASRSAADALVLAWFIRACTVALLGMRLGALRGWRCGAAEALAISAPAWPVSTLAWAASSVPASTLALAELLLLGAGLLLPWIGQRLAAVLRHGDFADALALFLGSALAAALWFGRGAWRAALF